MPHIALVTTSYPDGTPGADAAGSFVEDFAVELASNVRVTVIAASSRDSVVSDGSLCVKRFRVPRLPLSLLRPGNPRDWAALVTTLRNGRRALRQLMQTDPPDHVLALWVLPCGWWAAAEARPRGIRYSTWALGSDIWSLARMPVLRNILIRVLSDAEHRYADGIALCRDVEQLCDQPCEFLPSARTLPVLRESPVAAKPPYKLAFLGRWHPNKGTDLLLDALRSLGEQDWQRISEVRIFGGGPLEKEVHDATGRLGDDGRPVAVGGYLDKEDAAALIAWADYLLLPSRIESIPVVFSDAMQLSTPVISNPVGDLPRLHERYRFGVLANSSSAAGFEDAIRQALRSDASGFRPGIEAARKGFSPASSVRQFLKMTSLGTG
jgi:glycosyltransferase involved in cell wall biosynthesis